MISAYTYIHNALKGGYPVFEAIAAVLPYVGEVVVLDLESDDGTSNYLETISRSEFIRVYSAPWDASRGPKLLGEALEQHGDLCRGGQIIHFEADEVYSDPLIRRILREIEQGRDSLSVQRVQVTQNFQRARWWATPCHRVYPRGTATKMGHTTEEADDALVLPGDVGYLWDIANCFRDNFPGRMAQQGELWGEQALHLEPLHASESWDVSPEDFQREMQDPRWTWTRSPFDLPPLLKRLVGRPAYRPDQGLISLLASGSPNALFSKYLSDPEFCRGGMYPKNLWIPP